LVGGKEKTTLVFFIDDPPLLPEEALQVEIRESFRSGSKI